MIYESFNTSKKKIEKNWNKTEENLNDTINLSKQNIISFQNNRNPSTTIIPLIFKEDVVFRQTGIENFVISGLSESLISFATINRRLYRNNQETESFQIYTINKMYWKFVNNNTVLLQVFIQKASFGFQVFMDLNLIIKNPNIYTPLPKFKTL